MFNFHCIVFPFSEKEIARKLKQIGFFLRAFFQYNWIRIPTFDL